MSYLSDFEEINGGYVAFGGNPKGGKISGKGKIRTGKLDFDDVYFFKELKFNLFSVSQMCNKKNIVLFTDTECIVLSPEFKLLDKTQVLLRVPRENNMYNVYLKNIVPFGDLTCLFAKDETSPILKTFITGIENQLSLKVKIIRSDNGTKFKNDINQFCGMKGIKREFSVPRTPQQNGIVERKNRTLIEAARTMLADSLLPIPFWAKAVNTGCYVQNRVLVTKPQNKTLYELLLSRTPSIGFVRPFGCPVTILNTLYPLGKFDGKVDEGFLVGYSNTDDDAAFKVKEPVFERKKPKSEVHVSPSSSAYINEANAADSPVPAVRQISTNSTNTFSAAVGPSNTVVSPTHGKSSYVNTSQYPDDPNMPELEEITYSDDEENVGVEADFTNLETTITVSPIPTTRVHKDHPVTQIIGDLSSATQTMRFEDPDYPNNVYNVVKALYGLHQAPKVWYETLANYLLKHGFREERWIRHCLSKGKKLMKDKFQISSMGGLTFFWGLQVKQKPDGIFISQDIYVAAILRKFGLTDGKSASAPIDTKKPLLKDPNGKDADLHTYRSMIGSLMYLTSLRLDIMFAVCACARFQVTLKVSHLHAVKRIFRYLKGKPHLGLWYPKDSIFNLVAYSDSDYAGASLDRKSTTGGCQFLICRLISWQCKKQTVMATSYTEAELIVTVVSSKFLLFESIDCLPNEEIFTELSRMGYEKPSTKLIFYKAFFSPQWKFLIHIILQCMSAKRTSWNEFSSSMALAVICLSTGMIVAQQADDVVDEGVTIVVVDDVPAVVDEPSIPSPTPTTQPPPPSQDLPSTSQSRKDSSNSEDHKVKTKGGIIANIDTDEDVTLKDVAAIAKDVVVVEKDVKIKGNADVDEIEPVELKEVVEVVTTAKLMTKVVTAASATITAVAITLITTATIIAAPSDARKRKGVDEAYVRELDAELNKNINEDDVIDQVQRKEKEDNDVMRYQALKRKPQTEAQARKNMMIYLRNTAGFKMDYFKGMSYDDIRPIFEKKFISNVAFLEKTKEQMEEEDSKALKRASESQAEKAAKKQKLDEEVEEIKKHLQIVPNDEDNVYTEATPLARKVLVVDYEIYSKNNKPYYNIMRGDGSHQLFLSFLSLLRDFNREDLEMLWKLVKERFASSKPKNFSDDFLLTTLTYMFEKPDVQAQVWKN
nr:hypothetical protein [Tanacetum cinerariifolium]